MKLVSLMFLAVLVPASASAQNGIFVQAGPFLDILHASTFESSATTSLSLSIGSILPSRQPDDEQTTSTRTRFAPGGSLALGVFVSPSVSVRVEASFHGDRDSSDDTTSAAAGTRTLIESTTGSTDITVAAGWHQGTGRVGISYLAGMLFRRQTDETFTSFTYPTLAVLGPGGSITRIIATETEEDTFRSVSYDRGIMAGVDVSVKVSDNLAIVPHLRLVAASFSWNVRPGVSIRWRP